MEAARPAPSAQSAIGAPARPAQSAAPDPARTPMLEVRGFSKSYGGRPAVRDVSLAVMPRRIFGFVGPNGAGKTTLIRAIVGAQDFDAGDIRIAGMSVRRRPVECKQLTAYVPDNPDVYGFLTGAQYLSYLADLFEVPADLRAERIRRYGDLLGMTGRLGELTSGYSHGMRQKLVLMGALVHEPKLLVLDEPFVGLDPQASYNLKQIMADLTARGSAIFFSSHVLEVVEKLCDEVAIIRDGAIVRSGPTAEVCGDAGLEEVFLDLAREGEGGKGREEKEEKEGEGEGAAEGKAPAARGARRRGGRHA